MEKIKERGKVERELTEEIEIPDKVRDKLWRYYNYGNYYLPEIFKDDNDEV